MSGIEAVVALYMPEKECVQVAYIVHALALLSTWLTLVDFE